MFEVPDEKKSIGQNVFDVKVGSKVYKLPKFEYLTPRQISSFDNEGGGLDEIVASFDAVAKPKGLGAAMADIPMKIIMDLLDAWQKDSGLNVGESETSEG